MIEDKKLSSTTMQNIHLENREKQSNILLFHAWGTILGQSERCFGMISILLTIL